MRVDQDQEQRERIRQFLQSKELRSGIKPAEEPVELQR